MGKGSNLSAARPIGLPVALVRVDGGGSEIPRLRDPERPRKNKMHNCLIFF